MMGVVTIDLHFFLGIVRKFGEMRALGQTFGCRKLLGHMMLSPKNRNDCWEKKKKDAIFLRLSSNSSKFQSIVYNVL